MTKESIISRITYRILIDSTNRICNTFLLHNIIFAWSIFLGTIVGIRVPVKQKGTTKMIPMVMDGVGDRAQVSPVGLAVLKLLGFVRQKITNARLSHMPDAGIMQ